MGHFYERTEPQSFCGSNTIISRERELRYRWCAEDILTKSSDGKDVFDFFCFSYEAETEQDKKKRPVIFAFNGGPTVSSSMVHCAFWGPRILAVDEDGFPCKEEKGKLRDNPDCLLDIADICLIDPVNTGFSRLRYPEYAGEFLGDHQDAASVSEFVMTWLEKHGRKESPVWLSGESFGSTRASLMAWYLKDRADLRGIIHIGPGYSCSQATVRTFKDFIPAAALNWYHHRENKPDFDQWIGEVREFFYKEYVPAYYIGNELPEEKKEYIADKLSYFTSLSAEYYLNHNLRVDRNDIRSMMLSDLGLKLGSGDGRFTLPSDRKGDPFGEIYGPSVSAGLKNILKEMGIETSREYRPSSEKEDDEWDWHYNASPDMIGYYANRMPMDAAVSAAMKEHTEMKIFFATGYYDTVATVENTRYSIMHTDVDPGRIILREYRSGHAVYADDVSRKQLSDDIRKLLTENAREENDDVH